MSRWGTVRGVRVHAAGARAHALFLLVPIPLVALCVAGPAPRYAAVTIATLVPLAALMLRQRGMRLIDRPSALLMGTGLASIALHNLQNQLAFASTGRPAGGLLAAATLAVGYLLLLVGGARAAFAGTRRDLGGMIDAALIGLAAASLMWGLLLGPAHHRLGSSLPVRLNEFGLVLVVTALTGVAFRCAATQSRARGATVYLAAAMVAVDASDVAYTLTEDPVTHLSAWWASVIAIVALAAFTAALAHPDQLGLGTPLNQPRGLTRARLVLLGAALAVNPGLAGLQEVVGAESDVALFSLGSLLTVPLVVWRIGLLVRWHADAARRLRDLASLDELTGLANRRQLVAHLGALLDRVADREAPGALVVYLDLDDFKSVNDSLGHAAGDRLLCAVGDRLRACVRATDLVARWGGDEFVVVVEAPPSAQAAVVATVRRALAAPLSLGVGAASGRSSLGVAAVAAGERVTADTLLDRADSEMYRVKRAARPCADAPAEQGADQDDAHLDAVLPVPDRAVLDRAVRDRAALQEATLQEAVLQEAVLQEAVLRDDAPDR